MAKKSVSEDFAINIKDNLDFLQCPYTQELDATAAAELLITPGEERVKILVWLLSRIDPSLSEFLDNSRENIGRKPDAYFQKLLKASESLCLCSHDDLALITGDVPLNKQVVFCNKLLKTVILTTAEDFKDDYQRKYLEYIDMLSSQEDLFDSMAWKIDLIPKDLNSEVKRIRLKQENEGTSGSAIPDINQLTDQAKNISDELEEQSKILEDLQKVVDVQTSDKTSEIITMSQMLWTVLRELRQLVAGFTHCYESNIGMWCMKKPPQLSQLGASFKRVHGLLEKFTTLFEDVSTMRQLHSKLSNNKMGEEFKQQVLVQVSRETESFESCLSILEETIHRTQSNFTSQFVDLISV